MSPMWSTFTRVTLQHDALRWRVLREICHHRVSVTYLAY
jgi:hypothetical protein